MRRLPDSNELKDIVRNAIVGDYWPPHLQDEYEIESHIHSTVDQLKNCGLLDVDADFNSYGSGFASYVHVFCTKANRAATKRVGETDWISGIAVYLGRLVPFAAFGTEERTRHARGGSAGFLEPNTLETTPDNTWNNELKAILETLNSTGYTILPKADYLRKLPIRMNWETNFGTDTYFDAIFYWYD